MPVAAEDARDTGGETGTSSAPNAVRNLANAGKATLPRGIRAGALAQAQSARAAIGMGGAILSAQALRFSWMNLISLFGLPLIYINIHFLGRYFTHVEWFAPFGSEWTATATSPGRPNYALEYGEIIAMLVLDAFVATVLLILSAISFFLIWAVSHPLEFCAMIPTPVALSIGSLLGPLGPAASIVCAVQ
ncbi:hypothetical protein HYV74_02895 [Candidatus Uhrbacteria bacterium]|nr:hypothetical protein [Candidatus Uhrbacteria bacterium]